MLIVTSITPLLGGIGAHYAYIVVHSLSHYEIDGVAVSLWCRGWRETMRIGQMTPRLKTGESPHSIGGEADPIDHQPAYAMHSMHDRG